MDLAFENRRARYLDSNPDTVFSSVLRRSLSLVERPDEGQATNSGFKR